MPERFVALDTNVLLLYLVGRTDASLFRTFKRVQTFEPEDVGTLNKFLSVFTRVVTTPHVLAEASNFVDQAPPHRRLELTAALTNFIETSREHYVEARALATREEFPALGLSDSGLCELSNIAVIITTDFALRAGSTAQVVKLRTSST